MNRVLFVCMHRFPHGDAAANRLLAMAKSMKAAGLSPFVIGNGVLNESDLDTQNGIYSVEGVPYTSVRSVKDSIVSRIKRRVFQNFFLSQAVSRHGLGQVRCIVTTHASISLGMVVFCKYIWKKPIVVDCTEWHESSQFKSGVFSLDFLAFNYRFFLTLLCVKNIVGITKLLSNLFKRRGAWTLCLPPQVDVAAFLPHVSVESLARIELFYAGTVAGKDHLSVALEGLAMLTPTERARIRFTIAGPSTEDVARLFLGQDLISELGDSIRLLGRISRAQVLEELSRVHFSVLLRPVSRYSTAGFPSKIPESLAAGTPVMVNLTSDLGDYLVDMRDSLIVEDCTAEAFSRALRRALALSVTDLNKMISGAKNTAETAFDYRVWAGSVGNYIDRVG